MTSQMRRAAVSVAANIAEGSGKQYVTEFRQFLFTARASLSEVEYYIHLANRLGYLPVEEKTQLEQAETKTARTLQASSTASKSRLRPAASRISANHHNTGRQDSGR
jgi:four helix bundle protein